MFTSTRTKLLAVAAFAAILATVTGPTQTAGAGVVDNKTFTADVDGTTVGAAPEAYSGDADATIRVRLTNTGTSQTINSANVTIPAPYTLVTSANDAVPGGPVVELRNLGLTIGSSRDFTITVQVRTCVPSTPPAFAITAKQSNDYSGVGNDFYLDAGADLRVNTVGTCRLSFVTQPTDAERNVAITGVAFDPTGAKISVEIRDGGNTGRATHATNTIGLTAINPSVTSPVLGGTTSSAAVAGLSTFTPGPTLAVSSFGYTLRAASTSLTSTISSSFVIVDDQVNCPAGQACRSQATANKNGNTTTASFGTGTNSSSLLVSLDAADAPVFSCAGYPRPTGVLVSQFVFVGGNADDRVGTWSSTIPNASNPVSQYEACWAAPYTFTTESGAAAGVQGTKPGTALPLYVGILPDCGRTPVAPCVSARSFDRATSTATVTVYATGADPWRY